MGYYDDELALREAQINKKRKRNRKRLLIGAGAVAGGALALKNDKIRNKVTDNLRSDSQMMNNIGNGVRKVGKGIYNNFKPSATTMSIRRGAERAADAISNYTPKYNKRRRKLANIIDDLYHSGYYDGYYASMELYHADDEMTEEERRARRKRRRRNIALGVAGVAGVAGAGAAGYAIARGLRKKRAPRVKTVTSDYNPNADYSQKVKVERLYHADTEMTEEERARRKRRRRNIALGVAGVAGVAGAGAAGYAIARGLRKRGRGIVPTGSSGPRPSGPRLSGPRLIGGPTGGSSGSAGSSGSRPRGPKPTGPRLTGPTLKRVHVPDYDVEAPNGWDFKRNKPTYASDKMNERIKRSYEKMKRTYYDPNTGRWGWENLH